MPRTISPHTKLGHNFVIDGSIRRTRHFDLVWTNWRWQNAMRIYIKMITFVSSSNWTLLAAARLIIIHTQTFLKEFGCYTPLCFPKIEKREKEKNDSVVRIVYCISREHVFTLPPWHDHDCLGRVCWGVILVWNHAEMISKFVEESAHLIQNIWWHRVVLDDDNNKRSTFAKTLLLLLHKPTYLIQVIKCLRNLKAIGLYSWTHTMWHSWFHAVHVVNYNPTIFFSATSLLYIWFSSAYNRRSWDTNKNMLLKKRGFQYQTDWFHA